FRLDGGIMDMISQNNKEIKSAMINKNKLSCIRGCIYALKHKSIRALKKGFNSLSGMEYYFKIRYYQRLYIALSLYEKKLRKDGFDEYAYWRDWLNEISQLFSDNSNLKKTYTVLQNPFFYDETFDGHKNIWPELFSPYKLIFVHRDPLDQLSDLIATGAINDSSWTRFHGKTGGLDPLERFNVISKKLYNGRLRLLSTHSKEDVIVVGFEEFVQEHDRVSNKLLNFLGLQGQISTWDASISQKNIGNGRLDPKVLQMIKGKESYIDEIVVLREKLINFR
ncbi:sulfotransferase, partial [Shewanella sp. Isolate7]|uniref:sulfotransferase n=1 Tax=Shewanella sp. Isolate7 TaxID=2908528 RepID=UPI001EFE5B5B